MTPAVTPAISRAETPTLIRAFQGERTQQRPVWFMRQAGRSLPEYRAIREGTTMLQACVTPELAAEITVQPVRRHQVDAAIFYSDIMVPAKLAGIDVDIVPGRGPVLATPIRDSRAIANLPELTQDALQPIADGVSASVELLGDTPLIGFAGAPFTVASYLVEGAPSRTFPHTRALIAHNEAAWHTLATWVAEISLHFLQTQVNAGAQAVQLFDSWVGALDVTNYQKSAAPYSSHILRDATLAHIPRVHFGTNTGHILPQLHQAGASVIGVDAETALTTANTVLGGAVPLQGNINPALLSGSWEALEQHTREVLAAGQSAPGHVVNLGHGVPATTDPDVLTRLVALIHSISDPLGS
ncbi:MAG: uroporphyrinogen decarboxylase [Cellulomonadaceae bacterium]|jgi:uroporphyrinogen decarboxylase|nr:uroporphyrinogen decarboxylase [Cellulomonadaceae bacterium]